MGAILNRSSAVFYIDEKPKLGNKGIAFSPHMFEKLEWTSLKTFCLKRHITQNELNFLFKKLLSYDQVHVHDFRVRISDIREPYLKNSQLTIVSIQKIHSKNSMYYVLYIYAAIYDKQRQTYICEHIYMYTLMYINVYMKVCMITYRFTYVCI
jgi:hypothetical protein